MAKPPAAPPTEPADKGPPAEYTVVARRYRPQQFGELVGQEPVARALTNALQAGRVAHAYLFTGARGVGKTSAARILAKALNCVKGPAPTPCDQCDICRSIATGEDIDVLEIDGASNRGIDEVRAIRQNVQTRPSRARYKIYIIDEVHMLTAPAFNALLKTLEEPPPHVKFIFATTEVQKIPITILSRCQRFDFAGIATAKIAERLKQVVAAEGKQAYDEALHLVARRAGGSMRDAQSLLDQLLASGERLTVGQVHALLGTAADDRVLNLAGAILEHDATRALQLLGEFSDSGLQLGEVLDQLIEYWRNLMLVGCAGADFKGVDLPEAMRAPLAKQAAAVPLDTILAGLEILTATKARFRNSGHGLVLLEMAAVRLCRLADLVPVAELAQWLAQGGTASPPGVERPTSARPQPGSADAPEPKKKPVAEAEPHRNGSNGHSTSPLRNGNFSPSAEAPFEQVWPQVLEQLGPMLAGELAKAGLPAILAPKTLEIRFPGRYTGAYEYCKQPSSVARVEETLRQHGQEWAVRVEVEAMPAAEVTAEQTLEQPAVPLTNRLREREALQNPLLARATEVLGARLMRMEEGFGQQPAAPESNADVVETTED
jgi:DNA polymerase III subunit gamma/tau